MIKESGKIGGGLLSDNLLRNGSDLAFETKLLYLDVNNGFISINNDAPIRPLYVPVSIKSTNFIVDIQSEFANDWIIETNKIQNLLDTIYIVPDQTNPKILTIKIATRDYLNNNNVLEISDQLIENVIQNDDILLSPNGNGKVHFITDTLLVNGSVHVNGDITWDGDIIFGNSDLDSVTFNSDINSDVVPNENNEFDLGSASAKWRNAFAYNYYSNTIISDSIVNDVDVLFVQQNVYYVSVNGNDTNVGNHLHNPFRTLEYAISQCQYGDEIIIFPGTYNEVFPLIIPEGVAIRGVGKNSVFIEPTALTNTNDAFLLNSDCSMEQLTVQNFYSSYAFKLAPNYKLNVKSPFIHDVNVSTVGSISILSDPLGFLEGDAGGGAYLDGSIADPTNNVPPSCLFSNVTFNVPNSKGIVATNKVRVECSNVSTYFANIGIEVISGQGGFAGLGTTRVEIGGLIGTVNVGDTFTYYDDDEVTILAQGIVSEINGNVYSLDNNVAGLQTIDEIPSALYTGINSAIISSNNSKFGSSSLYLDGFDSYVETEDSIDYTFNDSDFCIECWIYPLSFPTTERAILSQWGESSSEQSFKLTFTDTGEFKFYLNDGSNTAVGTGIEYLLSEDGEIYTDETGNPFISENSAIILNIWQHIVLSRSGDVVTVYINGIEKVSTVLAANASIENSLGKFKIGASSDDESFYGFIDEVRISKNTPRYTSAFTPPTSQYSVDVDTSALLHLNGLHGSVNFVDSSYITQNLKFTNATASSIISLDYSDFGAQIRCTNSSSWYGNYGVVTTGYNVYAYLNSYSFTGIGTGSNYLDDESLYNYSNQIVENNHSIVFVDGISQRGQYVINKFVSANQSSDRITISADVITLTNSTLVVKNNTNQVLVTEDLVRSTNLQIYNNEIKSLFGDLNVNSVSNITNLNNNTFITGNLDVQDNFSLGGNIFFGDNATDEINVVSYLTQDINPNQNNTWNLGSDVKRWNTLYCDLINVDNIVELTTNTISTLSGNTNLQLSASGIGKIHVAQTDVQINQNLTVVKDIIVNGLSTIKETSIVGDVEIIGDIDQTGDFDLIGLFSNNNIIINGDSFIEVPSIKIYQNVIQTQNLNSNIEFKANSNGGVAIEGKLKFVNNTISNVWSVPTTDTQQSIILTPNGSGIVNVNSTKSLRLPIGNNSTRQFAQSGELRYNNITGLIDGWSNTGYVSLTNLWDSDRNTYITAELTPGSNDHTLRFGINGTVKATITETSLTTNTLHSDNVQINGNTINNLVGTNDLELVPSPSYYVNVNNIDLIDSSIINNLNESITLSATGTGYVKFSGTYGVVFPYGNTDERRLTPELGETRFNSDLDYLEVYNGLDWIPATGLSPNIDEQDAIDIMDVWSLILG